MPPSGEEILLPLQTGRTFILISANRHGVAFFNPSIYKKIGKDEFTGLQIDGLLPFGLVDEHPEAAKKKIVSIAQILHTASSWTHLNELTLENLSLDDVNVQRELGRFNHLRKLTLLKLSDEPLTVLAGSPILKGLKEFCMESSGPVDAVIDRLLADGSVTTLNLDASAMNLGLAKKLDQYNKIEGLELRDKPPPDSVLEAVGQIRSLKQLKISHSTISDAQISKLCEHNNIVALILYKKAYLDQDVARLSSRRVHFE